MRLCADHHDWVGTLQSYTQGIGDWQIQEFTVITQGAGYHQTNVGF